MIQFFFTIHRPNCIRFNVISGMSSYLEIFSLSLHCDRYYVTVPPAQSHVKILLSVNNGNFVISNILQITK